MKTLNVLFLLAIFSVVLFAGCATTRVSSSAMIRTMGIGESAVPIEKNSFAIELFNDKSTTIDVISATNPFDWQDLESNHAMSGGKVSHHCRHYGFNLRFGLKKHTEIKLGFLKGSITNGNEEINAIDEDGNYLIRKTKFNSDFVGGQFGIKHLLTDYANPGRISLYLDGKHFITYSDGLAWDYDGRTIELKPALIFGYLKDPASRNFPSFSFYYSLANTNRDKTLRGIPANKNSQAIGAEANLNLAYGVMYTNLAFGVEKEIGHKATDEIRRYFGAKIGFHFKQKKN